MESPGPAKAGGAKGLIDGLWIAAACALLYLLLGQQTMYRIDAHALLWRSMVGQLAHPYHSFYLPLLEVMKGISAPLGLSLYELARVYSALGTFLGLLLTHAANRRLGLPRLEAALVTAMMGLCPSVLFFATIVEVHGPFFCFVGLTYLLTAHLLRAPNLVNALFLGCSLGLSFLAHPLGALMGALLPVLWMWQRARGAELRESLPIRSLFTLGAFSAIVLLAWVLLLPLVLRQWGFLTNAEFSFAYLIDQSERMAEPMRFLAIVRDEWLLAFMPLSVAIFAYIFSERWRPATLVYGLALLPYLIACHLMLTAYGELGAYVIPMVWPMALLLAPVSARQPWLAYGLLGSSLLLGMVRVGEHDRPEAARELAAGMQSLADGEEFFVILGSKLDLEAYFVFLPDLPHLWIPDLLNKQPKAFELALAELDRDLSTYLGTGRVVLMSAQAKRSIELLVDTYPTETAALFAEHLERSYRFEPVKVPGFDGFRLSRLR